MTHLSPKQRSGILYTVLASFFLGWAPILGKIAPSLGTKHLPTVPNSGIIYKPGAGSERACKELCVIRRLVLVVLEHSLILAAGLVTAFFIFHQLAPLGFRQAAAGEAGRSQVTSGHEPQLLPVRSARTLERALPVW